MSAGHVLNARERKALNRLSEDTRDFLIKGKLTGVGLITLASLVELGLAEIGASRRYYGETGWRITPDGWRCMYGKTYEEMMANPEAGPYNPLKQWQWPLA